MLEQLFDEIFKDCGIGRALEGTRQHNPILSVCRQNLISPVTVKFGHLSRRHAKW